MTCRLLSQCDETHPTCNNCKKSKRDCLGYDPIFRQQTTGSSHIQPTPVSQPSVSPPGPPSAPPHPSGPRLDVSYGPVAYAPSPSAALSPASGGLLAAALAYNSPVTVKSDPGCDQHSPLDVCARHLPPTPLPDHSRLDAISVPDPDIRPDRMRVAEIIDLLGPPPAPQPVSHSEQTYNDITKVYHEMYAGGLSLFFESTWFYFAEGGKMTFPRDANLIEHMASFLKVLEGVQANDHAQMVYSGALETRIVWELACTAYGTAHGTAHGVPDRPNNRSALPGESDAVEVRNRLRVVEALLSGDLLTTNPLSPPVADKDQFRARQFDFWYSLAEFLRQRDSHHQAATAREEMLARMRRLLDKRENRDVLYSVAVVRHLAPALETAGLPPHLDETDPKHRLAVASKFILDEAQVTGGTTNVVRRLSDIAARAYVNPGVNVVRRTV